MGAYANGRLRAPTKAQDEAKTSGLGEDGNTGWRPKAPVPVGLLPKTPIAALQTLTGRPARFRLCALRSAFSATQRVCVHSVNRPWEMGDDGATLKDCTAPAREFWLESKGRSNLRQLQAAPCPR